MLPARPGGKARVSAVGLSWWLSLSIFIVWLSLTVLKCTSMGSDLMCVSESEGLVLVEVAAFPPLTTPLAKSSRTRCLTSFWHQKSHLKLDQGLE